MTKISVEDDEATLESHQENVSSVSSIVNESSITSANEQSILDSASSYSISVSPISYPSVSYVHRLRPPPLIPRTIEAVSPYPLAPTYSTPSFRPALSHLNLGSSQNCTRVPTVNPRPVGNTTYYYSDRSSQSYSTVCCE